MKNPLLKHFQFRISRFGSMTLGVTMLLSLLYTGVMTGQVNLQKTECTCLNNATTATNGQYLDEFHFDGTPGDDWRIVGPIIGFYHPASYNPPAAPILYPSGTKIPEIAPGRFRIEGKRISGQGWSVELRNYTTGETGHVESVQHCSYPNHPPVVELAGDANVCASASELYTLGPNPPYLSGNFSGLSWSLLDGGGTITPGAPSTATVNWGSVYGTYRVNASGVVRSYAGQPVGCNFSVEKSVNIVDPAPFTTIKGDFGNCISDTEIYTVDASISQLHISTTWGVYLDPGATVPAPGVTVTTIATNRVSIQWPSSPGIFYIAVRGQFRVDGASDYCAFEDIKRVDIVSEGVTQLACNNDVQITMGHDCLLSFSIDKFLTAPTYPLSSYDIMLRDIEADTIIPNGTLGYNYVGKTIEVKIIHECSGNSCWGYARIEDKSIPELTCPADVTINCDEIGDYSAAEFPIMPAGAVISPVAGQRNTWVVSGYDKCSLVTLILDDDVADTNCSGPYSSIITRRWTIRDNYNNESTCSQRFFINAASIDDVLPPHNYDDITGPNGSLEACDNFLKVPYLVNGIEQTYIEDGVVKVDSVPSPVFTGYPLGTLCLKSSVTYTDKKILLCGDNRNAYKLVRKWTVVDLCATTNNIREFNQLITVMDTRSPIVVCTDEDIIVGTKPHECVADWDVVPPLSISDCVETSWLVEFILPDADGNPTPGNGWVNIDGATRVVPVFGGFKIINVPQGITRIRYSVTDICGNVAYCYSQIKVVDNEAPIPVCDKHSVIAIGSNSEGWAGVLTFDDGSHDNCAITCMKIRRMDNPVSWSYISCDNQLRFTCDDIGPGKTVTVELGVWDKEGLFNSCMVEAKVQDNIYPVVIPPVDTTANCYEDFTNLSRFGNATVTDNCTATLVETRIDSLNECGLGTIVRVFTATDVSGNVTTARQVITVGNDRLFRGEDIVWPSDYLTSASCLSNIAPSDLPADYAEPRFIRNTDCSRVVASYEDIVFNFADNVCVKVLRKWTVVDWCQHHPFAPGVGEWVHTQLIMINNVNPPTIQSGCSSNDLTITQVGDCLANVKVTGVAIDDCTPENKLSWTYTIDYHNDGSIDVTGSGDKIDRVMPYGTHKLVWSVKDGCDNVSTCTNVFTIVDDKKPSPYCITEIGTVIMPSAGEVSIWASDFDRGSTDNCSLPEEIVASFSPIDITQTSRVIKCSDMDSLTFKKFEFNVYFIDKAGNSDFCTVYLNVQDNESVCLKPQTQTRASVKGNIYTEAEQPVEDVSVELMSSQPEFPLSVATDLTGKFIFSDLTVHQDYRLTPAKNDDILNGVSTLDLVYIQRHILGLEALNSPYKMIAADVNNSSSITAADLSELRKVILGLQDHFDNNQSWRFIDSKHKFLDVRHPGIFPEDIELENVDSNITENDFIAVKVGDVNESAATSSAQGNAIESRSTAVLSQNLINGKAGTYVLVHIKASELKSITGMQWSMSFDKHIAELVDVYSGILDVSEDNFNFNNTADGLIHFSWNNAQPMEIADGDLITLKFILLNDAHNVSLMRIYDAGVRPEVYVSEGGKFIAYNLKVVNRSTVGEMADKFELFQNIPNPFNATTVIGFNLPESTDVTLKVYDITGKVVQEQSGYYKKGYNSIQLDATTLNSTGVLYYQLEASNHSATRKMIIIK
ncbi:MAG: T9SS type A sorting domain-containing protein [Saprospiraceae bacterium]|nr:T9SS type A sorting domain-containing protein [Saprospiraceae bacterium]